MAISFPVPLATFFDDLPIQGIVSDLGEAVEMSETAGGEILTADVGNRLWTMECEFPPLPYATAEQIKAKFNILRYAGRSLLAHAIPVAYPQDDPDGSIVGSNVVTLSYVNTANYREIQLDGLPVGYTLQPGDRLSFTYGSSPTRYALHQVVSLATADGTGETDVFEVVPHIKPGYSLAAVVTLKKPLFKAVAVPGSFSPGRSAGKHTEGMGFKLIQTLR